MREYTVKRATTKPQLKGKWTSKAWAGVPVIDVDHFHERSSDHHPRVQAKMVYDDNGFYVIFRVEDRYVRAAHIGYQASVCRDSCVEFFVEPIAGRGYFNFEINCGGSLLLHYNTRSQVIKYDPVEVDESRLKQVKVFASLPQKVDPEITEPTTWTLEFFCPYDILEGYVGVIPSPAGSIWRGNFYKCADQTSHPHWAMWNPIPNKLGFHRPDHFAPLLFEA